MKISILLPYKENYSPSYAGAFSIFVSSICKISKFKKNITVFGSTNYSKYLSNNYQNIKLKKNFLSSQSKDYVKKFINLQKQNKPDIIEVHNRPIYIDDLNVLSKYIRPEDQTLSVFGFSNEELNNFVDAITNRGIDRVVPIGNSLDFHHIWDGLDLIDAMSRKINF